VDSFAGRGGCILSYLGGGGTVVRLKVWERGREKGTFPVEEVNEVKYRVLETVGFQGANPIYDGRGWIVLFELIIHNHHSPFLIPML